MSDYLWDKTGEVDAEAQRLEELLGPLGFRPRPLELPAQLPARAVPADFRAARARALFTRPRLAVAASLAVAALLGAWLLTADRRAARSDAAPQLAGQTNQPGAGLEAKEAGATKNADATKDAGAAKDAAKGVEAAGSVDATKGVGQSGPVAPTRLAAKPPRPRLPNMARGASSRRGGQSQLAARRERPGRVAPRPDARREETARELTAEEREAAEKVLYALRLTSEKLAYARQQVQEAGRNEVNR